MIYQVIRKSDNLVTNIIVIEKLSEFSIDPDYYLIENEGTPVGCVLGTPEPLVAIPVSELIINIDSTAANIYAKFTRFETEYLLRENAAKEYLADNTITPSIYLTSFAQASNKSLTDAANVVVYQAAKLRNVMSDIAALRMRKYELYSLSNKDAQDLADSLILQINEKAATIS